MPTTPPFNLNADPRKGQGAYGLVPGNIGLPSPYQDIAGVFPNLSGNLGQLSTNISHELAGDLDPQTVAMLQNTAAQFGIGQGVPLSSFAGAQGLRHLGLTSEAQRAQGAQHLLSALPTVANTLTVKPETQLDVANRNSTLNAAPDPEAAAKEAQRLFDAYLAKLGANVRGGGLSYSGGVGNPNAPKARTATDFMNEPWAPFNPASVWGGGNREPAYYAGTGINWGTQGPSPQDLWGGSSSGFTGGFPGPEGGSVATPGGGGFTDWFNDPFIGGGGGMFGLGQPPGQQPGFDWGDFDTPDASYLNEWDSGG